MADFFSSDDDYKTRDNITETIVDSDDCLDPISKTDIIMSGEGGRGGGWEGRVGGKNVLNKNNRLYSFRKKIHPPCHILNPQRAGCDL